MLNDLQSAFGSVENSEKIIEKLISNPEEMIQFNLLTLAKNHNFFASIDEYMKRFSQLLL